MSTNLNETLICGHPLEEYEAMIEKFHGTRAPGLIIGGFMVDLAQKNLPKEALYDVICESMKCLPDAVQVLTPCSIGNGWLKILQIGRYAFTFFDKYTGEGVRVYLDTDKMKNYPEIYNWFFKVTPKDQQDTEKLMGQIYEAGSGIISFEKVTVDIGASKKEKGSKIAICPVCHEGYPAKHGEKCRVCSGEITYLAKKVP